MLLPVPTPPASTSIPQSQAMKAVSMATTEGKKVELSSFEDAVLWFQSQEMVVENNPLTLPEIDINIDFEASQVPSAEILSTENLPTVLGAEINTQIDLEMRHQQYLAPINQSDSLQIPEVEVAAIEIPPQQSKIESPLNVIEDAGEFVETDLSPQEIVPPQAEPASRTERAAIIKFDRELGTVQPEIQPDTEKTHVKENQTLEVNSGFLPDLPEVNIPEVFQPATKTVQSVTQQVVEQTMAQISNNSSNQDSSFTVRLDPPELGEVLVSLKKSEGGIIMRVAAIEQSTQALLQLNELDLSQAMTEHQSDVTMEFGSQADFERSTFSHHKEFNSEGRSFSKQHMKSSQSAFLNKSSSIEESPHNFTA